MCLRVALCVESEKPTLPERNHEYQRCVAVILVIEASYWIMYLIPFALSLGDRSCGSKTYCVSASTCDAFAHQAVVQPKHLRAIDLLCICQIQYV
ncbi:hypothetical protein EJ08DRAFT_647410 [Tothia fuscella]|uniref:Uncharacterized protein n=1 Tax=Tothia fuscella TaxID=1048955 RepID=A0A9P4NXE2_9PEZI|nr:hypothetical protein EJ08DRAFT_647410 [Tothia fuscella]